MVICIWNLGFVWDLMLGIWDFLDFVNGYKKHYPWSDFTKVSLRRLFHPFVQDVSVFGVYGSDLEMMNGYAVIFFH